MVWSGAIKIQVTKTNGLFTITAVIICGKPACLIYTNMKNLNAILVKVTYSHRQWKSNLSNWTSPVWVLGPQPGWQMAGGHAPATGTNLLLGLPVEPLSLGTSAANLTPRVEMVKKSRVHMLFMRKPDSKLKVQQLRQSGWSDSSKYISVKTVSKSHVDEMFLHVAAH